MPYNQLTPALIDDSNLNNEKKKINNKTKKVTKFSDIIKTKTQLNDDNNNNSIANHSISNNSIHNTNINDLKQFSYILR